MNTGKKFLTRALPGLLVLALFVSLATPHALAAERKLSFAVSGVVASVNVRSGDSVKTGMALATLDQTPFIAHKRAADAGAKAAGLILDQAEVKVAQVRELFDGLSASQEEVDKAESDYANAQSSFEKAKSRAEISAWKLQRSTLRAPFPGAVSSVPGYPGMVVNTHAGSLPVVVVNAR